MKRSDIPLEGKFLNYFSGDVDKLKALFPRQGASFIVRNLVRQYLRKVEEDAAQKSQPISIVIDEKEME